MRKGLEFHQRELMYLETTSNPQGVRLPRRGRVMTPLYQLRFQPGVSWHDGFNTESDMCPGRAPVAVQSVSNAYSTNEDIY